MPETKPHPEQHNPQDAWTEEEKSRGAQHPDDVDTVGEAGEATSSGRPTDDRGATEGAASKIDPKAAPRP